MSTADGQGSPSGPSQKAQTGTPDQSAHAHAGTDCHGPDDEAGDGAQAGFEAPDTDVVRVRLPFGASDISSGRSQITLFIIEAKYTAIFYNDGNYMRGPGGAFDMPATQCSRSH